MEGGRARKCNDQDSRYCRGHPCYPAGCSEGININITLLFAQDVYVKVAEAYIAGLEQFAQERRRRGPDG